jgi:Bacterial extracellular solute-binding proteins, family 3
MKTIGSALSHCLLALTFLQLANTSSAADETIVIPFVDLVTGNPSDIYYQKLVRLAVEKTEKTFGSISVQVFSATEGKERQRALIKGKLGLDLMWSSASAQREQQLLAVKFNLLRQLSDYKILLIRCADKAKFAKIQTLHDLNRFTAGTGQHWQDTKILAANDIKFVTSWNYEPLFKMLAAGRFDYMIRGVQEVWSEIELHKNFDFCANETLLIHYSLPVYFFVNQDNQLLAQRIEAGLIAAEKDGSLLKLFLSTPGFEKADAEIKAKNRRVIEFPRSANL